MGCAQVKPINASDFFDKETPRMENIQANKADIKVVHRDKDTNYEDKNGEDDLNAFQDSEDNTEIIDLTTERGEIEINPGQGTKAEEENCDDDSDASQDKNEDNTENLNLTPDKREIEINSDKANNSEEDNSEDDSDVSQDNSEDSTEYTALTPEDRELEFSSLRKKTIEAQSLGIYTRNQEGDFTYTREAVEALLIMNSLYFKPSKIKDISHSEINEWRKRIAAIAIETKFMDSVFDFAKTAYSERRLRECCGKGKLLPFVVTIIHNYTDASDDLAVAVASYPGFLEVVKFIIDELREGHNSDSQTQSMALSALGIIHNIGMVESNIGRLREVDFLQILTDYLSSPDEDMRLTGFAALASIINEEESEVITANMELLEYLLKVLSKAMAAPQHRFALKSIAWSCLECTLIVRTLARNDANKKLLAELGALELLVKMGQVGNHEEQYEAVSALWALSFDKDIRKRITNEKNLGVVDLLKQLNDSEEKRIRNVCNGALWTLRDDLNASPVEKYRGWSIVRDYVKSSKSSSVKAEDAGHVMISYQWANQEMLKRIRNKLKDAGIKVWMDIEQMGGSTLQAMATAVEQATIVLICMSQNYRNSPNCRAEAEYAFQMRKTIVPLMMERDFKPDGWLGIICTPLLHFKFIPNDKKHPFEEVMPKLLEEIKKAYEIKGKQLDTVVVPKQVPTVAMPERPVDQVDSRPPPAAGTSVTMAKLDDRTFSKSPKVVRGWQAGDVQKWWEKHDLKSCGINGLTGEEISMLCMMYHRAPESFFKCMQNKSKLKQLLKTSRLVWAIDDLVEEDNDSTTE